MISWGLDAHHTQEPQALQQALDYGGSSKGCTPTLHHQERSAQSCLSLKLLDAYIPEKHWNAVYI